MVEWFPWRTQALSSTVSPMVQKSWTHPETVTYVKTMSKACLWIEEKDALWPSVLGNNVDYVNQCTHADVNHHCYQSQWLIDWERNHQRKKSSPLDRCILQLVQSSITISPFSLVIFPLFYCPLSHLSTEHKMVNGLMIQSELKMGSDFRVQCNKVQNWLNWGHEHSSNTWCVRANYSDLGLCRQSFPRSFWEKLCVYVCTYVYYEAITWENHRAP